MARGRDQARREAERELARRRNKAAHRSLRRRAERGRGARSAVTGTVPTRAADQGASDMAPSGPERDSEHGDERIPTSQLVAPVWLAGEGDAAADTAAEDADGQDDAHDGSAQDDDAGDEGADGDANEDVADDQPTAVMEPVEAGDTEVMPAVPAAPVAPGQNVEPAPELAPEPQPDSSTGAPQATGAFAAAWAAEQDREVQSEEQPAVDDSPASPAAEPAAPRRRRRAPAVALLVIVALAIVYVGAQALLSGTVPRDTQTLGVSIGGMSTVEATGTVADEAEGIAAQEITMEAGGLEYVATGSVAGLGIDADATVAQATGFTLDPQRLWAHVTGGGEIDAVETVDQESLDSTLDEAAESMSGPALDASVVIADGQVETFPGRPSVDVDTDASAERVIAAWPESMTVDLVAEVEDPAITDAQAEQFAEGLRNQVLAGPVTLEGEDATATVDAEAIAAASTVVAGPTGLELDVDGAALAAQLVEDDPDLATEGENASIEFDDDHQIVLDEGTPGITIDGAALGDTVREAAMSPARTGELPYTAADPEISAEDLGLDDLKEVVASFDTPVTADRIRTGNLRTAAAKASGTVLQPGDEFNLFETISPITIEEGYGAAGVIVDGILTEGVGGGLSQMATTTYNAAYFAGYELLQHRPHSVWFPRYPAGRESTLWGTTINVRFTNSTPYAAVVNSYVEGGRLHVDIWSTPHFEVETVASPKTNIQQPGVDEVRAADCRPKGPGQPGFTITNTRTVLLDSDVVDESSNTWTYEPDDAIECVTDDDDD